MLISTELEALRSNDAPQRRAQAKLNLKLAQWREQEAIKAIESEVHRFGSGEPLTALPNLSGLFASGNPAARNFASDLTAVFAAGLNDQPLALAPFRHFSDGTISNLLVFGTKRASLMLQAIDGQALRRREAASNASFTPGETWENVLSGTADADLVRIAGPRPEGVVLNGEPITLAPGKVSHRDGNREALVLRSVPTSLVTLKLQVRDAAWAVAREFRLSDGSQIHQATVSSRESRLELAAALLGRMGRSDAAPLLAAMAEERGSQSLRWQALKECIGLDSAAGFTSLCRIAARTDDPLAVPAGALRAQLIETYPQLLELTRCQG